MNRFQSLMAISTLSVTTLFASISEASITTYNNRTQWQSSAGISRTIDFSTSDSGAPISNPSTDAAFDQLILKGVTFWNVHSYFNSSIYVYPNATLHIDLPANTTAVGADLSSYQDQPGVYSVTISTGESFSAAAVVVPSVADFVGVISTTPLKWIEVSLNSSYLFMDNFSFVVNAAQQVRIDIKPDASDNLVNPVNPGSNGVIPVSIISTSTFDATKVNVASLRFGHSGTEASANTFSIKDTNGDGIPDLLVNFKTQMTGIICGDTTAKLTGQTSAGIQIFGSDFIKTTGCN